MNEISKKEKIKQEMKNKLNDKSVKTERQTVQ